MMQNVQERAHMLPIAARLRRSRAINDYFADLLVTVLLLEEIFRERAGGGLGQVLMLGGRQDLLLPQATECDAVFKRDHDALAVDDIRFAYERQVAIDID